MDIQDETNAELVKELRESNAKLQIVFDAMSDGLVVISKPINIAIFTTLIVVHFIIPSTA